ncbi:MAG: TIGR04076 family protein [Anaerolineaceae bacterium]
MKKCYPEEWAFAIEVLRVGKENKVEECRIGFEIGDTFTCEYDTPAGFCPTSFIKIFPSLEVIRCGGDWRKLGASKPGEMNFLCPDGVVLFRITARPAQGDNVLST